MGRASHLTDICRIGVACEKNEYATVAKTFFLKAKPRFAAIRLTAEGSCGIYVNGDFVEGHKGRLPNRVLFAEITSRLREGQNEIRIISVSHYRQKTADSLFAKRGVHFTSVAAEITVETDADVLRIPTDASWHCERATPGSYLAVFGEITKNEYARFWLRAALWPEATFDDAIPQAIKDVAGAAYTAYAEASEPLYAEPVQVYASDVLPAVNKDYPRPFIVEPDEHYAIFDFGRLVVGYPVLQYKCVQDVSVCMAFDYTENTSDFNGTHAHNLIDSLKIRFTPEKTASAHQLIHRRAARYFLVKYPASASDFVLTGLRVRLSMLPPRRKGWFRCDDALLNRMWEVGKYTLQVNKHQEYESCPRYEMKFFSGDGIMDALVDYYAYGDSGLADASLSYTEPYISVGLRPDVYDRNAALWDYPAWRVIMSYNHYLHTGDDAFVRFYYEELVQLIQWMLEKIGSDDLVCQHPVYFDVFFTQPDAVEYSCSEHRLGRKTYLNVMFCKSLLCMAELGRLMQDERASEWGEQAARMKEAINRVLWSDQFQAYYDQQQPDILPQEGNALAVLYGIADEARSKQVFAALEKHTWSPWGSAMLSAEVPHTRGGYKAISPLMCTYEAEARFLRGEDKSALELIRRCWGTMLNKGAETFWEFTHNDGTTRWEIPSHSWSAGCTYLLSAYAAGIRPGQSGYETLLFAPSAEVTEFTCVVPTPKGYIAASCHKSAETLCYTLALPKGMPKQIDLPPQASLTVVEY